MPNRDLAAIMRADALRIPLKSESVDLIISSPPYFALRSYMDEGEHYGGQLGSEPTPGDFLTALWRVLDECWGVLKPEGSCWINLGDKYSGSGGHNNSGIAKKSSDDENSDASRRNAPNRYNQATDVRDKSVMGLPWRFALGCATPDPYRTIYDPVGDGDKPHPQWINRRPVIWEKSNGLPESVRDRPRANFEDWFMLTKEGSYYAAIDEIREAHVSKGSKPSSTNKTASEWGAGWSSGKGVKHRTASGNPDMFNPLGAVPGSVWKIPSEALHVPDYIGIEHFAAFPTEWPRRIITAFSPPSICCDCEHGRRPVVDKQLIQTGDTHRRSAAKRDLANPEGHNNGFSKDGYPIGYHKITIVGYDCPCSPAVEGILPNPMPPSRPAVVLDMFGGTGTVAMVARALGRFGVSMDLSKDYIKLATWRIWSSGGFGKIQSKADKERQGTLI